MNRGKIILRKLAEKYPQLYLDPGREGAHEACLQAVRCGDAPEMNDMDHFRGDERDNLETVHTPAGPVEILTLYDRTDFETFLRIMAYHCRSVSIPETQGAATLNGIVNWPESLVRREVVYDTMIILSSGPYSHVDAAAAGFSEEEWLQISLTIRRFHECTHVVCRRLYPDRIDAVWDELTADAIGIYAALDRYDPDLEKLFLGIQGDWYIGGRLQNYVQDTDGPEAWDRLAGRVSSALAGFVSVFEENRGRDPFTLIFVLEEKQSQLWTDNKADRTGHCGTEYLKQKE